MKDSRCLPGFIGQLIAAAGFGLLFSLSGFLMFKQRQPSHDFIPVLFTLRGAPLGAIIMFTSIAVLGLLFALSARWIATSSVSAAAGIFGSALLVIDSLASFLLLAINFPYLLIIPVQNSVVLMLYALMLITMEAGPILIGVFFIKCSDQFEAHYFWKVTGIMYVLAGVFQFMSLTLLYIFLLPACMMGAACFRQ